MSQKMQLQIGMKQQLRMTQQLQQAIRLLQLSRQELGASIQEEMTENPALEELPELCNETYAHIETGEPPAVPGETPDLSMSLRSLDDNIGKTDTIDWDSYLNEYQTHTPMADATCKGYIGEDLPSYEATLTAPPTLVEHLMRQVKFLASRQRDRSTKHATRVLEHEIHFLRCYLLGCDDEVALVLAVFIVHDDYEFSFLEVLHCIFDAA